MKYGLLFKILVILGISPVCASKFYEICLQIGFRHG